LLLFALRHKGVGSFILKHLKIGEFKLPDGTKYRGFKFSFKW